MQRSLATAAWCVAVMVGFIFTPGCGQSVHPASTHVQGGEHYGARLSPQNMDANQQRQYQDFMKSPTSEPARAPGAARPAGSAQPASSPPPAAKAPGGAMGGGGTYNPNMYVDNTYMGGSGERDRVEKLINEGVLVQGKRVKLEAFTRDYGQAFPVPTSAALALTAQTERSRIVREGDRTFLQVGLQAMKGEAPRRAPLNLALVLDRSGSMQEEDKIGFARAAASALVDRLGPQDVFALVAFDNQAELLIPAQRVRDRAAIRRRIDAVTPGASTNIYDGLELGYREVRKHATPDTINRVLLLSDGEVTAGVNDPEQFRRLAANRADEEIQTTAVGVGIEFNEELMLSIAREGRGNYHFIKDGADTRAVFAKELDELTHVVARAVRLRVRLADGIALVRVLGARELDAAQTARVKADEKKIDRKVYEELGITPDRQKQNDEPGIKTVIPDFYRGDSHVVMMEIAIPPGGPVGARRPVAEVFLKYKDLVTRANRQVRTAVHVVYAADRAQMVASTNRSVKKNLLGFQTGEALVRAAALIERGRPGEAARVIDERMVVLGVAAREWNDRDLERDGSLLDRYKTVIAGIAHDRQIASSDLGQYLRKSLSYSGYELTR